MPATCLRDGCQCLLAYVNICRKPNTDTSPTSEALSASNRRSWIGFNSPDRSPLWQKACLRLICNKYFYVNCCLQDGTDKINVVFPRSLRQVCNELGACLRCVCDTVWVLSQAWLQRDYIICEPSFNVLRVIVTLALVLGIILQLACIVYQSTCNS